MPRYHVRYYARQYGSGADHAWVIDAEFPIEYDSDIEAVQQALALIHGPGASVTLMDWRELKGKTRPESWHCVPCRSEWPTNRPCDACARPAQSGRLPRGLPPVAP